MRDFRGLIKLSGDVAAILSRDVAAGAAPCIVSRAPEDGMLQVVGPRGNDPSDALVVGERDIFNLFKKRLRNRRETYESGHGVVESYTKDKTRDHDEIVLRLKDGRRVVISNNTKLGIRVEPKEGDEVNYHGYGVKGTNVVHKVHPNKRSRGGWLEHVKKASIKSPEDLDALYSKLKYRILHQETGRPFFNTDRKSWDHWHLLSPEHIKKHKIGICWDTAAMTDSELSRLGVPHENYFSHAGDLSHATHSFNIYKDKNGDWRWIEGSWGPYKGNDWKERRKKKLLKRIVKALEDASGDKQIVHSVDKFPDPGVDGREFYDAMLKMPIKKAASYSLKENPTYEDVLKVFNKLDFDDRANVVPRHPDSFREVPDDMLFDRQVAVDGDGNPVGFNEFYYGRNKLGRRQPPHNSIAVVPEARGNGLARLMVEAAVRKARKEKIKRLVWEAFADNEPSIRAALSAGFEDATPKNAKGYRRFVYRVSEKKGESMRKFSRIGLMKLAGMGPVPKYGIREALHDGGVNLARVGLNLAKPFAWAGDTVSGAFGHKTDMRGALDRATPQYRDESLATDPVNSAIVAANTGVAGAGLAWLFGLPSLIGGAASALSPAAAAAVGGAATAATVASPVIAGINAYYDQKNSNTRREMLERSGGIPVMHAPLEGIGSKARRVAGTVTNWLGGTDPYSMLGNMSSTYQN